MKRRKFAQTIAKAGLAPAFLPLSSSSNYHRRPKQIKPSALKSGDTVGLVTPASSIRPEQLERAKSNIEKMGFQFKIGNHASDQNGFLAGLDYQRVADLHDMLKDDKVKALWCIRGGYGMTRILSEIDTRLLIKYPKLIIGYSDITALHNLTSLHGLTSVHGQVAGATFTDEVMANMRDTISGNLSNKVIRPSATEESYTIFEGRAKGHLTGGNLSLLASMAGTPFLDSFKNKIVFIEDIGEKPYRIDRMLTQLIQSTDLKKAAGIALGNFADCEKDDDDKSWTLKEVLFDRLRSLEIPTCYGFPFGHVKRNLVMPMHCKVELDASSIQLTYKEEVVV